jgi:hypothetical protein
MKELDHLADHTLTYWAHWKHSMKLAVRTGILSLKSIVHAFSPNTFADDGPTTIYNTYHEIKDLPNVNRLFAQLDATVKTK